LERTLVDLRSRVGRLPGGDAADATAVGVELLAANSNRGPMLLNPRTIDATRLNLDRVVQLGARCVTETVIPLARRLDAEFCSFFWMNQLYGYVEYDARAARMTQMELRQHLQATVAPRILRGEPNGTGRAFKRLVGGGG
jgi:hypothetical protein